MKKAYIVFVFLMAFASISAQDRVEDLTHNSSSNTTSSGSQPNPVNVQVYCEQRYIDRSTYDGDAVTEKRANARNLTINNSQNVNSLGISTSFDPNNVEYKQFLKKATQAFVNKKYTACINLCDAMLTISRHSPDAYFLKGACHYALDKKEIGIQFFKIAVAKGSKDAEDILKMIK